MPMALPVNGTRPQTGVPPDDWPEPASNATKGSRELRTGGTPTGYAVTKDGLAADCDHGAVAIRN
jgi:hypothetical protein